MSRLLLFSLFIFTSTITKAEDLNPATLSVFEEIKADTLTLEKLKTAIANGADLQKKASFGFGSSNTWLEFALQKQNLEVARMLVEQGAPLNTRGVLDMTPLMLAAQIKDSESLLRLLAERGADLFAVGIKLDTAYDLAKSRGLLKNAEVLAEFMASGPTITYDRFLVINFVGIGGGGNIQSYLSEGSREELHHLHMDQLMVRDWTRAEIRKLKTQVQKWMTNPVTGKTYSNQSLILVGSSWGANPSIQISNWFFETFGRKPILQIYRGSAAQTGVLPPAQ